MAITQTNTIVKGIEEKEATYVEKQKIWLFFPVTYWEKVSETSFGNDIFIETTREIKNVYINGKLLSNASKQ